MQLTDDMQPNHLRQRPRSLEFRPALVDAVVFSEDGFSSRVGGSLLIKKLALAPSSVEGKCRALSRAPFPGIQGVDGSLGLPLVPQNEGDRVVRFRQVARQGGPSAGHSP
ncbi:hypothetical protein CEXT_560161 [Caerostris extrusa]|uniref:Uncharacterized protein n=1 Tax=Caerostris extrusa TaxID=172846 RepID=A0AAV4X254_CAEEX|nr:hypothetical protein CEXT_560161 [Caerostris extrusa]